MSLSTETAHQVLTVGIAELIVSDNPRAVLVTHALGSCVAVVLWDPVVKVGGLLHYLLPAAKGARPNERPPAAFADTGVPLLFEQMYAAGAKKERLVVRVAGGASVGAAAQDLFEIGTRNYTALRKLFWKNSVMINAEDVGGTISRTLFLNVASGALTVRTPQGERQL